MIDHDNLAEFTDADAYDLKDPSDTGVAFYIALARETGGPVLELACGTGRVSIPIARLGYAVTGLDIVPGMVERARRKSIGLPTRWVEGDARAFDLGERFRLIFLTGNAFQLLLTNTDQAALLKCVRAHLAEEGLFAFETRNPRWASGQPHSESTTALDGGFFADLETRAPEPLEPPVSDRRGRDVRVSLAQTYDHVAQLLHLTRYERWRAGDREHVTIVRLALRYTFPQELTALLHYHGFMILRQYGDWNHEPLTATSRSIIVVCRASPAGDR